MILPDHNPELGQSSQTDKPSPEVIRAQIAKICSSEMFAGSTRMQCFLKLVVDYALQDRTQELKEYLIAVDALGRDASFDPRQDPIVRVEARRLRTKLKQYYEGPGRADTLRIEFSKGHYAPRFLVTTRTQPEPRRKSIAVLPFRNLGPEPDREYFSDGLSEELIHLLMTVPELQVMAWNSSARLSSGHHDLARMRRELKVDVVLCGTVRRAGDQLRITAQLIDTAEAQYLWSEIYERRLQDLFAIEEEIARAIVNTLQIKLGRPPVASATKQKQPHPEAYHLYLLGRFYANRRTADGLTKSISCFEKAIQLDPEYAQAHGALAEAYCLAADYGVGYPADYLPLAKTAAERALLLNPQRAEAYTALAFLLANYDWEWDKAEHLFRHAVDMNPDYATARHWFAVDHLANLGRWKEAGEQVEIAHQLDPLSAIILQGKGYLFLLQRKYDEALRVYRQLLEIDPYFGKAFSAIGRVFTQTGRYAEAIEAYEKAKALGGEAPNLLGALGQTYALAGREAHSRQTLQELTNLSSRCYVPTTCFALIHLGLGETNAALQLLEQGAERRDLAMSAIKVHPAYDALRSEPRFRKLLHRLRLM
jgi:TolB-like protein/Tfp pilus assembly protein PilF